MPFKCKNKLPDEKPIEILHVTSVKSQEKHVYFFQQLLLF